MFESDSDEEINLSYKSVTCATKKEDVPLKLWAEHFSKPEKDRNTSLTRIFEKEFNFLKSLYCFLENDQVMGKTLTKFGIPNVCGKINRKLFKLSSKHSNKVNKYERRNNTYLSKPRLLSKKINLKSSGLKGQQNVTSRYPPVVERWSDLALKKYKVDQKIQSAQTYNFDNDHISENSKQEDAVCSTAAVVGTHSDLPNKPANDTKNQEIEEGNDNSRSKATVLSEPRGLLKRNDNKYGFKKCVRFNDNDLCSFAPTQELSEDSSRELSNNETVFDDLLIHQPGLVLSDNSKTDSDKSKQRISFEIENSVLDNTSTVLPFEINNLHESDDKNQINQKKSVENDFEVEPYDNVVIEEFTESNSVDENELDQEKSKALYPAKKLTESTNEYIINSTEVAKISKQISNELIISNNLKEANTQDKKYDERTGKGQLSIEKVKKTKNYVLTGLKIDKSENVYETHNINITGGKNVDLKYIGEKQIEMSSIKINANSKTSNEILNLTDISDQTSSQEQSVRKESKDSDENVIVPETPSSDESIMNNFFKSNIVIEETPSSNENEVDCRSLALDRNRQIVLTKKAENDTRQELQTKNSSHFVGGNWSDDEFIPLSPLQLKNQNENSANITAINGSIVSSENNDAKCCLVNKDNELRTELTIEVKYFEDTQNGFGMLSPCDSLSDREYISDSSQCESEEEQLSSKVKHVLSNVHKGSQNINNLKTIHEANISEVNNFVEEDNKKVSNHTHNDTSLLKETTRDSSDLCTPSESQTGKVGLKQIQSLFGAKAPCKADKSSITDSSTVDKSQVITSQDNNHVFNLMSDKTSSSINPVQILGSENKVRKTLFPLQTQPTVCVTEVEDEISHSKHEYMTTNTLKILNWKETENKINKTTLEEKNNKENCSSDDNAINIGLKKAELVQEELCDLNQNEDSFSYSPVSLKSSSGSPSNDVIITGKLIECDEDSFSVCSSTKNDHNINISLQNECALTLLEVPSEKDVNSINKGLKNSEIKYDELNELNQEKDSLEYSPMSLKSSTGNLPHDVAVVEKLLDSENVINEEVQLGNPNFISCTQTKDEDSFSVCSPTREEHNTNISLHNESDHTLLELASEREVFFKPDEMNSKNAHQHLDHKTCLGSEREIPVENAARRFSTQILFLQDKSQILKNNDISDESNQVQNKNWPYPSFENEIIINKKQINHEENQTSDKLDSPTSCKSASTKHFDANQDQEEILKLINKGTSFTTTIIRNEVCNEKSHQEVCENKSQITVTRSPVTSVYGQQNQNAASVMATTSAQKILSSTSVTLQPSVLKNATMRKHNAINLEESTNMENTTSSSKIKNEVFQTIGSIKVSGDKNEVILENTKLSKNKWSAAETKLLSLHTENIPVPMNISHVNIPAEHEATVSDISINDSIGKKKVYSLAIAPRIQTNQNVISHNISNNVNPTRNLSKGEPNMLPVIKGKKQYNTKIISLSKKEKGVNRYLLQGNNDSTEEAPILALNEAPSITETTHLMTGKSPPQGQIIGTSKSNEKHNVNEMYFTQEKERSETSKVFITKPVNNYTSQNLSNDDFGALRVNETNQSQTVKRVEQTRNVGFGTSKSRLYDNSSVLGKIPIKSGKLYSSNMILPSNKQSTQQSKQSDSDKDQINGGRKDNKKYHKIMVSTTSSIPVISSSNNKENENISFKGAKCHEPKSTKQTTGQMKQPKEYQMLVSGNAIKLQNHTPKLEILKQKMVSSKNKTPHLLRFDDSNQFKNKSITVSTNLLPVKNWHRTEEQTALVNSRSTEVELKKKSPGTFATTGNLCVIGSSSYNQEKPAIKGLHQIRNKQKDQNTIFYESVPKVNILCEQENSYGTQTNKRSKMEEQHYHKALVDNHPQLIRMKENDQHRNEINGELKEGLKNASQRKSLNKHLLSYTSPAIKTQMFSEGNTREAKNNYKPVIENSPPDSDDESFNLEDNIKNLDDQFNMSYKDRFQLLLTSDDESIQDANATVDCTDGNFSPTSSTGSDILLNDISKSSFKSFTKQLKRKLLKNSDYSSDELDCGESPTKFTRTNIMSSPSSEMNINTIYEDENIISSDGYVPSFLNDKSDCDSRDKNDLDSIKASDFTSTMITDSPVPSYSDELNNYHLLSSPTCPNDEADNSPLYDIQSSDDARSDYCLTDMFDD